MLRLAFTDRLRGAMKARDARTISTVRLIIAGLKDRDIAARGQGNAEGLSEAEIHRMLQAMVKQRRESIALYEQGNRADLAQQEREEIAVIESFLPRQLDEGETEAAARAAIAETGAASVKESARSWRCSASAMPASSISAGQGRSHGGSWADPGVLARAHIVLPLPSHAGEKGRGQGDARGEMRWKPTSPSLSPRWAEREG